jgi:hypothetical protein
MKKSLINNLILLTSKEVGLLVRAGFISEPFQVLLPFKFVRI